MKSTIHKPTAPKWALLSMTAFLSYASSAHSAVILTVSEDPGTGGVSLVASGTIDTSALLWTSDATIGNERLIMSESAVDGHFDNETYELFKGLTGPFGITTAMVPTVDFDTLDMGTHGNSFNADGASFYLYGASSTNDDLPLSSPVVSFDFVMVDNDGDIGDWSGASWEWDSNRTDPGGETITLNVIPEPTSAALLLGVAGWCGLVRRRPRSGKA